LELKLELLLKQRTNIYRSISYFWAKYHRDKLELYSQVEIHCPGVISTHISNVEWSDQYM